MIRTNGAHHKLVDADTQVQADQIAVRLQKLLVGDIEKLGTKIRADAPKSRAHVRCFAVQCAIKTSILYLKDLNKGSK